MPSNLLSRKVGDYQIDFSSNLQEVLGDDTSQDDVDPETPVGGDPTKLQTGSLEVKRGTQRYDLITNEGSSIFDKNASSIKIKKIYHYSPSAINRYFPCSNAF